jgi:hypothetical protein
MRIQMTIISVPHLPLRRLQNLPTCIAGQTGQAKLSAHMSYQALSTGLIEHCKMNQTICKSMRCDFGLWESNRGRVQHARTLLVTLAHNDGHWIYILLPSWTRDLDTSPLSEGIISHYCVITVQQ